MATIITGCPARGCNLRKLDFFGRRLIGDGAEARSSFMKVIGDRASDSTAGSIMATDTAAAAMTADVGMADVSITTAR